MFSRLRQEIFESIVEMEKCLLYLQIAGLDPDIKVPVCFDFHVLTSGTDVQYPFAVWNRPQMTEIRVAYRGTL